MRDNVSILKETSATAQQTEVPSSNNPIVLYNTLSRRKEAFCSREPGVVNFYSCGPTVYDFAHIGNFRAFLTYDILKRWLMYRNYKVNHVMNITDVEDKIIKKVNSSGGSLTVEEVTNKYASAFFEDLDLLNIIPADKYPRATQHIEDIERVIIGLRDRGHAYEVGGSTYFSVSSFPKYGRLAELSRRKNAQEANEQSGPESSAPSTEDRDDYDKSDIRDFALWKAYKDADGEVFWDSKALGKGRPGWHIECSCMALRYLGHELDIHSGGIDLVFPHHENEIAQSEALTGKPFSRFWVHNGFVNIDDEKMSKSLGNFKTVRDVVRKPDDARAFRYLIASSHYRSPLNFTQHSLKSAKSAVKRLDSLRRALEQANGHDGVAEITSATSRATEKFTAAMDDDLNTPRAAAALFEFANSAEKLCKKDQIGREAADMALACLEDLDRVFGIFYTPTLVSSDSRDNVSELNASSGISEGLQALLDARAMARKAKDWAKADEIRNKIGEAGYRVVDTPTGPVLETVDDE